MPENTYSPNGHRLNLDMRLHELRDELKVAEGRSEAMQTTIGKLQQKLAFLSSKEKEFVRLKLRQEASENLEFSLSHRVDEARLQMLPPQVSLPSRTVLRTRASSEPLLACVRPLRFHTPIDKFSPNSKLFRTLCIHGLLASDT